MFKKSTLLFLLALLSGPVLWAQIENPLAAAKEHLQKNLKELDLTEADLTDFVVSNQYVTKHNKVTHVYLKQRHQGIEVHNAIFNINFLKNGEVLNYGNRWLRNLASRVNTTTPQISKQQAVVSLMQQFNIPFAVAPAMVKEISANEAVFDHNGIALEPIEVKLVYQEAKDRTVRLTWNVSFYETNAQHWWNARIDAETGQVIDYFDQVLHCDFGTPEALCDHDHAHTSAHFELPEIDAEETFEVTTSGDEPVYRVFPLFVESPNHGERTLEVNPADPVASPFGWHDTDGEEGAEFTITRGNNVHAYHDIFNQNQSNGDEPDGGDTLCFDFPLDLSTNRPYTQLDPVVTNLFYWNNVMHDLWYGYGFDEASGNFQVTNYTGEGAGGDAVQAEALDGSGTNNANMSTPPEGGRARMQMFLWGGQLPNSNIFRVESPEEVAGDYPFIRAAFGASFPEEPLTSEVVIVDDAVGTTTDACQSIVNGADIDGKIAMIDRGGCEFGFKVLAAEQEGAIAVIICNNQANAPGALAPGDVGDQVTIPSLMISQGLCAQLRLVENLTVSLSF
ncbi:MAG: M36 family metallopeptidase, partial [Bacteroidota bacterium]